MNLRAWKLWSLDGKPAERTEEIVAVLESVLARDPNHLGANHYYIHTVEASPSSGRALTSAMRLDSLAPAAGHLAHMPAHIYARTGDQAAAARANLAGAKADREYFKTAPADNFYGLAYYTHNLHFLADSEMMQGRLAGAATGRRRSGRTAGAAHADDADGRVDDHDADVGPAALRPPRRNSGAGAAAGRSPGEVGVVALCPWRRARAHGESRTRRRRSARRWPKRSARVPEKRSSAARVSKARRTSSRLRRSCSTRASRGRAARRPKPIRLWTSAVAAADKMPYDEPPVCFYPVRESLGAALLLSGNAEDAERVFRDDLARHPRNARSLFGLHESLVKQGKTADADWVKRRSTRRGRTRTRR